MTISREQVADLREGDVVELCFPSGSTIRGPLTTAESYGPGLGIPDAGWTVRDRDGNPGWFASLGATLTVVSRAPRPLYANHPRTQPVLGDVVRMENDGGRVLMLTAEGWIDRNGHEFDPKRKDGLRLLVDGETGQVVQ